MAITLNVKGAEATASTSPLTVPVTVASGTNTALFVVAAFNSLPGTVTIVYDSAGANITMSTLVTGTQNAYQAIIFGCVGVTGAGVSKNISMSWTTTSTHCYCVPIAFDGVNQTGGTTTFPAGDKSTAAAFTQTVTNLASGDLAIYGWANDGAAVSGPTQTLIWAANHSQGYSGAGQYALGSTGSVSAGWSGTTAFTSGCGLRVVAASGSGGSTIVVPTQPVLGVGIY